MLNGVDQIQCSIYMHMFLKPHCQSLHIWFISGLFFNLPLVLLWISKSLEGLLPQGRFLDFSSWEEKVPGTFQWKCTCMHTVFDPSSVFQSYYQTPPPAYTFRETTAHKSIIFLWVLTSSVAVALGGLTLWHAILISRGETSVERHINRKETKRLKEKGKVFRNPYHHGKMNNWRLVLGVETKSHWFTRVLLPSNHLPRGDGIMWDYRQKRPHGHLTFAV